MASGISYSIIKVYVDCIALYYFRPLYCHFHFSLNHNCALEVVKSCTHRTTSLFYYFALMPLLLIKTQMIHWLRAFPMRHLLSLSSVRNQSISVITFHTVKIMVRNTTTNFSDFANQITYSSKARQLFFTTTMFELVILRFLSL